MMNLKNLIILKIDFQLQKKQEYLIVCLTDINKKLLLIEYLKMKKKHQIFYKTWLQKNIGDDKMKKKIDNFTLIFLLSSIIGFIIGVFYFLFGFIGDSYRKNEYLRANKTYAFERKDPLKTDDSDIILKNERR